MRIIFRSGDDGRRGRQTGRDLNSRDAPEHTHRVIGFQSQYPTAGPSQRLSNCGYGR